MEQYKAESKSIICLGKEGEYLARNIRFDISVWRKVYGSGTAQLLARRSGEQTPYPVAVTVDKDTVNWP